MSYQISFGNKGLFTQTLNLTTNSTDPNKITAYRGLASAIMRLFGKTKAIAVNEGGNKTRKIYVNKNMYEKLKLGNCTFAIAKPPSSAAPRDSESPSSTDKPKWLSREQYEQLYKKGIRIKASSEEAPAEILDQLKNLDEDLYLIIPPQDPKDEFPIEFINNALPGIDRGDVIIIVPVKVSSEKDVQQKSFEYRAGFYCKEIYYVPKNET